MATELGVAYLSIIPETSKLAPGIKKALGGTGVAGEADKSGKSLGKRFSGALGKVVKTGGVATATAAVATLGTALYKGFSRLQGLEQARAKLTGLGHSAASVEKIMGNALAAVKGTAFGLDSAATVAASAVAAGVKPGRDLQKTLTLVGDAATIAGTGMGEMGAIFNKVAAANKIQGDVIAQLNDAGIPVIQLLGKEMGTTAEETLKLASEGKVNFATFQRAMEKGLGGAAQESGKTVSGSFANMQAALGRLGASLLGGVFSKLPSLFGGVTEKLDSLGPAAARMGKLVGRGFKTLSKGSTGVLKDIGSGLAGLGKSLVSAARTAAPAIKKVVKALAPLVSAAVAGAVAALSGAFKALGPIIKGIASAFAAFVDVIPTEAIQIAAVAIAGYASVIITTTVAQAAITAATKAWAVAQRLLNVAMRANPIGLVVAGLAALVAGLVMAYKKSETFRKIVDAAFSVVRKVVGTVVGFITTKVPAAFDKIVGAVRNVLGWVRGNWPKILAIITGPIGLAVLAITKNWDKITNGVKGVYNGIKKWLGKAIGFIRGIPGKIKSLFAGIWHGIANGLKSAINAILHLPIKLPKVNTHIPGVGTVGGQTLIPALATGTKYFQGGMALVGEEGPELVNLPRGAQVYTASQTRAMASALQPMGDGNQGIDYERLAAAVASALHRMGLTLQIGRNAAGEVFLVGQNVVAERSA